MNLCSPLSIRLAGPDDAAIVTEFSLACARDSEGLVLDTTRVRAGVQAVLADAMRGRYYLAENEPRPIGQIMITGEWSDWRNAWIWWLQSVYVHPEHRRQGIFRALLEHIEAEARRESVALLRLYVDRNNGPAERTYLARGFGFAHYQMLEKRLSQD
jgi:GNAT superfamily N-acetyltransferase